MARPERNNVDYFPFICKEGKSMHYIETKYRNDGFATWVKILRELAKTDFHYLNLTDKKSVMYLTSKCMVAEEVLFNIINDLTELEEFDKDLWDNNKIIFSQKFVNSIEDAYARRSNKCITLDQLKLRISGKNLIDDDINLQKGVEKPQSIVEDTKVKETKTNNSKNLIEIFFNDLPNSSQFEDIIKAIKKPNEDSEVIRNDLIKFIPAFKLKAELEYQSFIKFATHFKNSYLKSKENDNKKTGGSNYKPGGAGKL